VQTIKPFVLLVDGEHFISIYSIFCLTDSIFPKLSTSEINGYHIKKKKSRGNREKSFIGKKSKLQVQAEAV
jgi:hypothetical protein